MAADSSSTPVGRSNLLLLVDYENVPDAPRAVQRLVSDWVRHLQSKFPLTGVLETTVRLYGGWWSGAGLSPARERASEDFAFVPALIEVGGLYCRIRRSFADELLLETAQPLYVRETYSRRPAPSLGVRRAEPPICGEPNCELQSCRKWFFKRRACTFGSCQVRFGDAWERGEQKQVDVHLATDLFSVAGVVASYDHVAIASDDLDFVPAIAAVAVRGLDGQSLTSLRVERDVTYLDVELRRMGIQVVISRPQA